MKTLYEVIAKNNLWKNLNLYDIIAVIKKIIIFPKSNIEYTPDFVINDTDDLEKKEKDSDIEI